MTDPTIKALYNNVLQFSILAFTSALVYFAFVYYPKTINAYKTGRLPARAFVPAVAAQDAKFPIETSVYRIAYENQSDTYYMFIAGANLDQYLLNKNGADLALKNVLSEDSLCSLEIIYASTAGLSVPEKYKVPANCR